MIVTAPAPPFPMRSARTSPNAGRSASSMRDPGVHADADRTHLHWHRVWVDALQIWQRDVRLADARMCMLAVWRSAPHWEWEAIDPAHDRHLAGGCSATQADALACAEDWMHAAQK